MAERSAPGGLKFVFDSGIARAFQNANIWIFRKTGGKLGAKVGKAPILLLTTVGRKSGKPRTVPLLYLPAGDKVIIVASKGGWPDDPLWYRNLKANSDVEIEIGGDRRDMTAATASAEEKAGYWSQLVAMYSDFNNYQSWTDREIPVVVLTPR